MGLAKSRRIVWRRSVFTVKGRSERSSRVRRLWREAALLHAGAKECHMVESALHYLLQAGQLQVFDLPRGT